MSAKIAQALHEVMSKVSYVQKTGKNAFHGYKYAGEADLLEKLRPAMLDAGLLLIPSIKGVSPIDEHGVTTVQMEYTLVHKDGDIWPSVICAAGQGGDKNKNGVGDKGLYKAITGANKYLLFKLFQIETGDDPEMDSAHDNTKRENPHTTKPEDIFEPAPDDILPAGDAAISPLAKKDAKEIYKRLQDEMNSYSDWLALEDWGSGIGNRVASLPVDWQKTFKGQYREFREYLQTRQAAE